MLGISLGLILMLGRELGIKVGRELRVAVGTTLGEVERLLVGTDDEFIDGSALGV